MLRESKYTKSDIIKICNEIHNNSYIYDNINFKKTTDKVDIICKKHGSFSQKLSNHLLGKGCKSCYYESKLLNLEKFIEKSNSIYKGKFNYDEFQYIDSKTPSVIKCEYGHKFMRTPNRHLTKKDFCNECKKVSYIKEKLSEIRFDGFEYLEWSGEVVDIKCKKCLNIFKRKINTHIKLKNCPICKPKKDNKDTFIKKSIEIHGDKYDYSDIEYINSRSKVSLFCKNGHKIEQKVNNHLNGSGCPLCNRYNKKELSVLDFIKSNYNGRIIKSDRFILKGKEIDIYLPELNIAFEFNGLYWHSDIYKDKFYHLNKYKNCIENGIQLINIWEDDWDNKNDIIKSMIINKLGKSIKIWARKCVIKTPSNSEVREFLNNNHIQGFVGSKVKIGLYYLDELVSLMTFGNLRKALGQNKNEEHYELLRFCNKKRTTVIGGPSKMINHFLSKKEIKEMISYSDNSMMSGNLYEKLGFKLIYETTPNYYWIIDGVRKHRFNFRKDKLIKEGYDPNMTEYEIMKLRGYNRIYDCGSKKWTLKVK